jgi:hypothetical protein
MPSRSASSPDGRAELVGCYLAREGWVVLSVLERAAGGYQVLGERHDGGEAVGQPELLGVHRDPDRARLQAEALVLARGGRLGAEPGALCEGPVRRALARSMFTEIGLRRFVHVPAAGGPGRPDGTADRVASVDGRVPGRVGLA